MHPTVNEQSRLARGPQFRKLKTKFSKNKIVSKSDRQQKSGRPILDV